MRTLAQKRAHFSMWAITSAPLIYSADLRRSTPSQTLAVLTHPGAVGINQQYAGFGGDLLGGQGRVVPICVKAGTRCWC